MGAIRFPFSILVAATLLLSACAAGVTPQPHTPAPSATSMPTSTTVPSATFTALPTVTASPTPTPSLTPTPVPSPTLTLTPTITPTVLPPITAVQALDGLVIKQLTGFESDPVETWVHSTEGVVFQNGEMKITGNKTWDISASPARKFKEGEGLMIYFQFEPGSIFEMYFDVGEWNAADYKRIGAGVYNPAEAMRVNLFFGPRNLGGPFLTGNFVPKAGVWYIGLFAVSPKGDFLIQVWEPANSFRKVRYREVLNPVWSGQEWNFTIKSFQGALLIEEAVEITFSRIK